MIEHYQRQTGEVAKRPQQVHAFQKRWAEISWAKRCPHPQHTIEQSFDPHIRCPRFPGPRSLAHRQWQGQHLLHHIQCIQSSISNAAPIGAETPSRAPSGPLGKREAVCNSFHRNRKKPCRSRERGPHFRTLNIALSHMRIVGGLWMWSQRLEGIYLRPSATALALLGFLSLRDRSAIRPGCDGK
jgi:hypothetical protein